MDRASAAPVLSHRAPWFLAVKKTGHADRAQAKLENQEAQIRELQGALRQMELDRARQQAELNTLSQLWTGAAPLPAGASSAPSPPASPAPNYTLTSKPRKALSHAVCARAFA